MGMTMTQKILAQAAGLAQVQASEDQIPSSKVETKDQACLL